MRNYRSLITAIVLFFATNTGYAASWVSLDSKTAKKALSDVTISHQKFKIYLAEDGSSVGEWGGKTHHGDFHINEEGHYCAKWQTEGKKDIGCWALQRKKKKLKMEPASGRADKAYTVKIKPGYTLAYKLPLSTEQVTALISNKTIHGTSTRGKNYRMYFAEDGSLTAGDKKTGKWEVKDGSVCNTWDERGFAGCDKVFKTKGKVIYTTPSGKKGKFRKFEDGNTL